MEYKRALIIGAGEDVPDHPLIQDDDFLVLCADGGGALARRWNLRPSAILGDQDSLDEETKKYWQGEGVPFYRYSTNKNQTDLDLAVDYALKLGAAHITLVGAWGSRIDHSLGNVELLYRLALEGIPNSLVTKKHCLRAFCRMFQGRVKQGSVVSLLPLSLEAVGVTTHGLRYALQDALLQRGQTLTISNQAEADVISVTLREGVLLIVTEE